MPTDLAKTKFTKIDRLTLNVDGTIIPLVSANMNWGVDSSSSCQVVPVVGSKILPNKNSPDNIASVLENLDADQLVTVEIEVDGEPPVVLHTGFPVMSRMETSTGAGPNSSVLARSLIINSRLGLLQAYSPSTRVFFNQKETPSARLIAQTNIQTNSDGSAVSCFFDKDRAVQVNLGRYIINLLADLQETLRDEGESALTDVEKIRNILESDDTFILNDAMVGAGTASKVATPIQLSTSKRAKAWANSDSLAVLQNFNKMAFLHTVPLSLEEGTFLLGPTLPMGYYSVRTLSLKETLSVERTETFRQMPPTQVWVAREWGGSRDATGAQSTLMMYKSHYHRWPENMEKGAALVRQPPALFANVVDQQLNNGGTGTLPVEKNKAGVITDGSANRVNKERREERTQDQIDSLGKRFAQMYYAEEAYRNVQATITVPWSLYTEMVGHIGANIKFTIPFDFGVFIGNLARVNLILDRPSLNAVCVLNLTHVRTEEDNEKWALDVHPAYLGWIGKTIESATSATDPIFGGE